MKTFLVSANEMLYYLATEIKADNEEQAVRKYMKKLNNGDIPVNDSEQGAIQITEVIK
jgi:hypothetical protein